MIFLCVCVCTCVFVARSTINNNLGGVTNKKDIKESQDSNNVTIEDEEGKLDRISNLLFSLYKQLFKNKKKTWRYLYSITTNI